MPTVRLTMAQALVKYLIAQRSLLDGQDVPLFPGVFAIFGHGNVAGLGEAMAVWDGSVHRPFPSEKLLRVLVAQELPECRVGSEDSAG